MGKNTSEGDLNAAIAVAKGIPAKAALKHAGYSETVRKTPKKVLRGPRMQDAFRRMGLALLEAGSGKYRDILESHGSDPKLLMEIALAVHEEWIQNGKKELPGFLELPEYSRRLLLGIGADNEDLSLIPAESVTPDTIGKMALQMLWKEMLDPPTDARSRIQVIDRGLDVGGFTGKNAELHLHQHQHGNFPPVVQRMIAERIIEIQAERAQAAKNTEIIDAEIMAAQEGRQADA